MQILNNFYSNMFYITFFVGLLVAIWYVLIVPYKPMGTINGCRGTKCQSDICVGRYCRIGESSGTESTGGDCFGEYCKAGDCAGSACEAGDCYGYGCTPGICKDPSCKPGSCPKKGCTDGQPFPLKTWNWWKKYVPNDTLPNPPVCDHNIYVRDIIDGRLDSLGIGTIYIINGDTKIKLHIDNLRKEGSLEDYGISRNDKVFIDRPNIYKNDNCDFCNSKGCLNTKGVTFRRNEKDMSKWVPDNFI